MTSEWQPIETAPKDGTWIIVFGGITGDDEEDRSFAVAQWSNLLNGGTTDPRWMFAWYDGGYYGQYYDPTHWMPLPPPPGDE